MHELALTQSILDIALEELRKHEAHVVREIRICTGPFSGVVPQCVQMYFDLLSEGTPAAGAKIVTRRLPLRVRCRACGAERELEMGCYTCPACGGDALERLSGNECFVESLEVD